LRFGYTKKAGIENYSGLVIYRIKLTPI